MSEPSSPADHAGPRNNAAGVRLILLALGSLLCAGFFALGTWQVQRLQWKQALIERVQQRVHAAAVPAPSWDEWSRVSAETAEYRHVQLRGVYLPDLTARVQAVTDLGSGYWLLTPLCRDDGSIVLVNRGFVPGAGARVAASNRPRAAADACAQAQGLQVSVSGLLRISEPGGGFLRQNNAAADRWYSRDVPAIAASRKLESVAPYFVDADADADASAGASGAPVGGLTVIYFHNNHLVYAVTWYILALMVAGACWWAFRNKRALRKSDAVQAKVIRRVTMAGGENGQAGGAGGGAPRAVANVVSTITHAAGHKNMQQLIQLRWLAVIGQVVTISVTTLGFGVQLPLHAMLSVLVCLIAFNIASTLRWQENLAVSNRELLLALLVDVASLTAQLHLSGGITNPFAFLYLLQVILSVVLLEKRSTWLIVGVTSACLAGLAVFSKPLALPLDHGRGIFSLYIQGMLLCFVLDAALLVVFTSRIMQNLRSSAGKLADLRQSAAEKEHIVRMGLLASGAAHELGTPLATLAVILGDWRRMPEFSCNPELLEEIAEMQTQLQRCKSIVSGILLSAGEARGESSERTTINAFLSELVEEWRVGRPVVSFEFENHIEHDISVVSDSTVKQMICNVLDNALEASPEWSRMEARVEGDMLDIQVIDSGPGFAPAMLAQFGKPYQSSKGRTGGGLGLFLVVNVARMLGGVVTAKNRPEGGASVRVSLPLSSIVLP